MSPDPKTEPLPGMDHSESSLNPRRRKAFKPRSRKGCQNCKRKHIKCDESFPSCKNCIKSDLTCDGSSVKTVPKSSHTTWQPSLSLIANPTWGYLESRKFNKFANHTAPLIGTSPDHSFWVGSVLPVARANEAIFNAVLANAELHEIPSSELLLLGQVELSGQRQVEYQHAIQWYSRSMESSRQIVTGASGLSTMLLSSVLYIYNERRLGHDENAESLMKIAFSFTASSETLKSCKDSVVLASLIQLLTMSSHWSVDCTRIPKEERKIAMMRALQILSNLGSNESVLLRLEFISLQWDLADAIEENTPGSELLDLEQRIKRWSWQFKISPQLSQDNDVATWWLYFQVQWQVKQFGVHQGRVLLEHCLNNLLRSAENVVAHIKTAGSLALAPLLDIYVVPTSLFISWYWRHESTGARITKMLEGLTLQPVFVQQSLDYISLLMETPYEEPTKIEQDLFGGKPEVFQVWQMYQCASQLAKLAALSEFERRFSLSPT